MSSLSENVTQVLTAGWDRLACIWDVDTGELLQVAVNVISQLCRYYEYNRNDHIILINVMGENNDNNNK